MDYQEMEKALLNGIKATLLKQNFPLNVTNYSRAMKIVLENIIIKDNYNYITNSGGHRDAVRDKDYVSFLVNRVGDRYHTVIEAIDDYAYKILPSVISSEYLSLEMKKDNGYVESLIRDVQYFSPSNRCREAVLSGKQTSVRYSEERCAGMQCVSSVGKVRENQEDSCLICVHPKNSSFKMLLVADGMGGLEAGEIASNTAAKEMVLWFEMLSDQDFFAESDVDLTKKLNSQLLYVDEKVKRACPHGGGTTLCVSIIKNHSIIMANAGDSLGFVLENGVRKYTTPTDGLNYISKNVQNLKGFEDVDLDRFHPRSNMITNGLGNAGDNRLFCGAHIDSIPLKDGCEYQVVLCTDGVSDCLSNKEMNHIVNSSSSDMVAKDIVRAALNSRSSFREELEKCKVEAGLMGRFNYRKLERILEQYGMGNDYERIILGGKDNTTAVSSGVVRRGR